MKTIFILFILVFTKHLSSQIEHDWILFATSTKIDENVYYDSKSIQIIDGNYEVWTKSIKSNYSYNDKSVSNTLTKVILSCSDRSYCFSKEIYYYTDGSNTIKWHTCDYLISIEPESIQELLYKRICIK